MGDVRSLLEASQRIIDGDTSEPSTPPVDNSIMNSQEYPRVSKGHDGSTYLVFRDTLAAELFLTSIGADPSKVPLYCCGGYENGILINETMDNPSLVSKERKPLTIVN